MEKILEEVMQGVSDTQMVADLKRLADKGGWAYLLHHVSEAIAQDQNATIDACGPQNHIENLGHAIRKLDELVKECEELI